MSSIEWSQYSTVKITQQQVGGGTLVYQAGYYPRKRTFKTHPKHVFFRYENRPYKYVFLHALFLICLPCPFQNLSIWPKIHPFPPILHVFCTPKRCTRVHCLVLKNNPNYIFSRMISNFKYKCPPPGYASRVTKRPYPDSRPMQ